MGEAGEAGEVRETAQHTDSCAEGCSQPACSCAHTPGRSDKHSPASLPWEQGPDPHWSHPSRRRKAVDPLRPARGTRRAAQAALGGHSLRGRAGGRAQDQAELGWATQDGGRPAFETLAQHGAVTVTVKTSADGSDPCHLSSNGRTWLQTRIQGEVLVWNTAPRSVSWRRKVSVPLRGVGHGVRWGFRVTCLKSRNVAGTPL